MKTLNELNDNSIDSVITNSKLYPQGINIWDEVYRVVKPGGHILCVTISKKYHIVTTMIEDVGFEIRDQLQWFYKGNNSSTLRPLNDPICMARKPLSEGNTVDNIEKWGVGAINIDGSRIGTDIIKTYGKRNGKGISLAWSKYKSDDEYEGSVSRGRFPANVILDEEAGKILDKQSGISKSTGGSGEASMGTLGKHVYGKYKNDKLAANAGGLGDTGGASRYFYCPTDEMDLYKYLIRMITPLNGTVLDPFMKNTIIRDSTTELGFDFIGIDVD